MNRWDEIQGAARDIADWVCGDPADRNRMADDLIKLVCLVVQGVGKGVAIKGETAMNGPDSEADAGFARYLVGEDVQDGARTVLEESSNAGCDLERYERDGLTPAWKADPSKRGAAHRFAPGELSRAAHRVADGMRASYRHPVPVPGEVFTAPATVKHPLQLCDDQDCLMHGDRGRVGACVQDGPQHVWVTATDGDTGATLDYTHCGVCGIRRCDGSCGDASVGAAPDADCPTHGRVIARSCNG